MFPTSIYMDRSENLSDIGYYFFGDYFWGSNDEVWWWTYHSVFGSYEVDDISVANIAQNSDENRMNQVFNGYYVSAGDKKFVQDIQTGTESSIVWFIGLSPTAAPWSNLKVSPLFPEEIQDFQYS